MQYTSSIRRLRLVLAGALLAACHAAGIGSPLAGDAPITLERLHADPPLQGRLPREMRLSPGGRFASYLAPSKADSEVLELWVRPLAGGEPRRIASAAEMLGGHDAVLTEAEKMALERRRILQHGITDYGWCGEQDTRIVVALGGDLHLIELDGDKTTFRRLTFDEAVPERDPRCDRAGERLAFVKQNDLWAMRLDGSAPRRLTETGSETRSTGLADFIAAEEFDRFDGFWWSDDGSALLALEVDESGVAVKGRMQIRSEGSEMAQQRYPAAGETNARVQALRIDVATARVARLVLPANAEYLVRAGWFHDGTPWLQWLTRDQTELHVVEFPDPQKPPRSLVVDTEPTWVEVHNDLRELDGWPLSGKPSLLWSSERSGRRQLWQIDRVTGVARQLTHEAEPVDSVVCASAERIVFTARRLRGRAQELLQIDASGTTRGVSEGPARRWQSATADSGCTRLLVSESDWSHPPRQTLVSLKARIAPIAFEGDAPDPMLARIVPQVQALDLLAADGKTTLNAFYMPPLHASKNPRGNAVIVSAYGGPTASDVTWAWHREAPLFAYWQSLGFGVMLIDPRGSAGRDRDFTHAHYRKFGNVEIADVFAAARQLPKAVQGVDADRIGLIGWSYGGYLAARSMLDDDTPFAAAVAGAPVTDWTLYDSAYTERYLGMPDGGKAPTYRDSNLASRAAKLTKQLMILHGTSDDNVLFEHSLRLIEALENENKLFETIIYPGQTHGVAGRKLGLHRDNSSTDFFVRHLQP